MAGSYKRFFYKVQFCFPTGSIAMSSFSAFDYVADERSRFCPPGQNLLADYVRDYILNILSLIMSPSDGSRKQILSPFSGHR